MNLTEHRTWMIGFDLYTEGETIEACACEPERNGWRAARLGHAHSDNIATLVDSGTAHEQVDNLARRMTAKDVLIWNEEDQIAREESEWNALYWQH